MKREMKREMKRARDKERRRRERSVESARVGDRGLAIALIISSQIACDCSTLTSRDSLWRHFAAVKCARIMLQCDVRMPRFERLADDDDVYEAIALR